jgi:hypothetical protein
MRIVMQRSGQVMVLYIQALVLRMVRLCKLAKLLLVNFIHTFQNVVTLCLNLLAQLKLNIKHWLVHFTNQVLLIRVGLMIVLHKLGEVGQQLVTIVRKIHQLVLNLVKRGN